MPERSSYPDGAPCWADVMTSDALATAAFYRGVFGWDVQDMGEEMGHYMIASVNGKSVAAITPPPPGSEGAPSAWTVYLKSSDVAKTAEAVEKAGGKIAMAPMEVPTQGHMMMAADPTGAIFGVWQPDGMTGAELYAEDGAIGWADVHTHDSAAADAFYPKVFPLTAEPVAESPMSYTVFKAGDDMVSGCAAMGDDEKMPPYWIPYFMVSDADAAVTKVQQYGGSVMTAAEDTPYGRMSVVADPAGAHFVVIKPPTG